MKMKMAEYRVLDSKERGAQSLVEVLCRAWTSALYGCGKWSESELQQQTLVS
jgi:hypothetical protein